MGQRRKTDPSCLAPCVACDATYELTRQGTCEPAQCQRRHLEILLVIDSSYNINVKDLTEEFIGKIKDVDNLGADKTDISILVYRNPGSELVVLERSADESEIAAALQKIDPIGHQSVFREKFCDECDLISGLESARSFMKYNGDQGYFQEFKKDKSLAVIFTAAHRNDLARLGDIQEASYRLQEYVDDVAAVGLGANLEDAILEAM